MSRYLLSAWAIAAVILCTYLVIRTAVHLRWVSKVTKITLDPYKVYAKMDVGIGTFYTMLLGVSVSRQVRLAGHKCRDEWSGGSHLLIYAEPEIIGLIKLYCDNGGFGKMCLSEFIFKSYPPNKITKFFH